MESSPLVRKFYGSEVKRMERGSLLRTPPAVPETKPLSQLLRDDEPRFNDKDGKLLPPPPAPPAQRKLNFSAETEPQPQPQHDGRIDALESKIQQLTDMMSAVLEMKTAQQMAQPAAQNTTQSTQPTQQMIHEAAHQTTSSNPEIQTLDRETATATALQTAMKMLQTGETNDRSVALSGVRVDRCTPTHNKYKAKINTAEQLAAAIAKDHPAWKARVSSAISLKGASCKDALTGLYNCFAPDFGITDTTLADAVFWCVITDQATLKATIATGVLHDFLYTNDAVALLDNYDKGMTGVACGLAQDAYSTATGCGDLSSTQGWKILLAATLAAYAYSGTLTQQVKEMTTAWKVLKQNSMHLSAFLTIFEHDHREIARVCRQGQCTDRTPTVTDCLDVLRDAVQTDLLTAAEYRLIKILGCPYDAIDYPTLKKALLKEQQDRDDAGEKTARRNPPPTPAPITAPPAPAITDPVLEQRLAAQTTQLQKLGLCLYNVVGRCRKGADCTYKHDSLESVGLNPADFKNYEPATRHLAKKPATGDTPAVTGPASQPTVDFVNAQLIHAMSLPRWSDERKTNSEVLPPR